MKDYISELLNRQQTKSVSDIEAKRWEKRYRNVLVASKELNAFIEILGYKQTVNLLVELQTAMKKFLQQEEYAKKQIDKYELIYGRFIGYLQDKYNLPEEIYKVLDICYDDWNRENKVQICKADRTKKFSEYIKPYFSLMNKNEIQISEHTVLLRNTTPI